MGWMRKAESAQDPALLQKALKLIGLGLPRVLSQQGCDWWQMR